MDQVSDASRPPLTWRGQAWRLAVCMVISVFAWSTAVEAEWTSHRGLFWTEIVLGVVAYVLVLWRRAAPVPIALGIAAMSALSGIAAGPATLAAVSVATQRRAGPIVLVGVVNFVAATTYTFTAPFELHMPPWVSVVINLVVNSAMMGWGMYLGSRRELIWTLHQRAVRAESERDLRLAQARSVERERIAREMHDVLAHRITQVSMQAGALAFRDDLAAEQLRSGLKDIQGKANEAIHELRGVLGVLRDHTTGALVEAPQPTHADIAQLVERARQEGVNITYDDRIDTSVEPVPGGVGRALYRIVQEGITNAHKHAPGAALHVTVDGGPDEGLNLEIANPLGFTGSGTPGAGLGLVGLAERVELRGGRLAHGVEGQWFVLRAWIPWTT
ncbi:sensor histidine kinase [Nocardioides seonyuensis]|nr:histidine kinase [Nocardioides seonyuensis]